MSPPRILLFGPWGQVGWELRRTLAPLGTVVTAGRAGADRFVDLTDPDTAGALVAAVAPDWVVNAAAYTAVDAAEDEPERARSVNADAPAAMAQAAAERGIPLLHFSTDYVFDGSQEAPYTEADTPAPLNVYGETKLAGERAVAAADGPHLILRTSWVYGLRGRNFLCTMRRLAAERDRLEVVADQTGAPTWARWIAEATAQILGRLGTDSHAWRIHGGVVHVTNAGATTWYGFLGRILERAEPAGGWRVREVTPTTTEAFGARASRPRNSVLAGGRLELEFGLHRPTWTEALDLCLEGEA